MISTSMGSRVRPAERRPARARHGAARAALPAIGLDPVLDPRLVWRPSAAGRSEAKASASADIAEEVGDDPEPSEVAHRVREVVEEQR